MPWHGDIFIDKYFLSLYLCRKVLSWVIFSVTRRSRSDESHLITYWVTEWALALTLLMWPWWVMIPIEDFTDVILITLMKVILWWKLSSGESYLAMKVILWWKLSIDESYLVMKVKIVKEVKRSDVLWRFACGDVCKQVWSTVWIMLSVIVFKKGTQPFSGCFCAFVLFCCCYFLSK